MEKRAGHKYTEKQMATACWNISLCGHGEGLSIERGDRIGKKGKDEKDGSKKVQEEFYLS